MPHYLRRGDEDVRARRYAAAERLLAAPMLALSLLVIPVLLLPLAWPSMPHPARNALDAVDVGTWIVFAAEYLLLLVLAPSRWGFVRTHLVELALVALPMLRPLRVLRAVRVLRGARVVAGAATAAKLSRRRLASTAGLYAPLAAAVLVLSVAAVVRDAERGAPGATIRSYGDAVWWAMTTVTTVGYGDRYPVTTVGRVAAVALMVVGVALLGLVTATMASAFTRWASEPAETAAAEEQGEQAADLAAILSELRELRAEVAELRADRNIG